MVRRHVNERNLHQLSDGDFFDGITGWSYSGVSISNSEGITSGGNAKKSLEIVGSPTTGNYAAATVEINLPGTQTYVLSGWAKAYAVPDSDVTVDDREKAFNLRAKIVYTDESFENILVPFNAAVSEWQFTSSVIVPSPEKTVDYIMVVCGYERNANVAHFDNISLVREPAQSMKYDADGNLILVTSTDLANEAASYSGSNLIGQMTGGNGYFSYTYDTNHNVTKIVSKQSSSASASLTQSIEYDGFGNAESTTLKGSTSSYMSTSASYTTDGNRLRSVTDSAGLTVQYGYPSSASTLSDKMSLMTGQPISTTAPNGNVSTSTYDAFGRTVATEVDNGGTLNYTLNKGNLMV